MVHLSHAEATGNGAESWFQKNERNINPQLKLHGRHPLFLLNLELVVVKLARRKDLAYPEVEIRIEPVKNFYLPCRLKR